MTIKNLVDRQLAADRRRGFKFKFESREERYDQVTKELVGLYGEIGEFSNVVKKINLRLAHGPAYELNIDVAEAGLAEELADSLIYMLRISAVLDIDLEAALINKMEKNDVRYGGLENR